MALLPPEISKRTSIPGSANLATAAALAPLSNRRWLSADMGREFTKDVGNALALFQDAGVILGIYGTARDHAIRPETMQALAVLIASAALKCPDIAVLTGGGPGSMRITTELANQFAKAFAIKAGALTGEKIEQSYSGGLVIAENMMWTRRFLLTTLPSAVVGTPGGIGTVHELIEHASLHGRGLLKSAPAVCLDTPEGLFAALQDYVIKKVLPYEKLETQRSFPDLWRIVDPYAIEQLAQEGIDLTDRLHAAQAQANQAPGPVASPNARWFTPEVLIEAQEDLSQVLELFDSTVEPNLCGRPLIALMGDLSRFGDHAAAVLKELGVPNAVLLTDDPRGRGIAERAGMASLTLVNDLDGTGAKRGVTVDGEHFTGCISHLVCAKRFVLTTAPAAVLAYPGDLHTLDKILELAVLHQVGLLKSQTITCVDSGGYYSGLIDFAREHLERGGYSTPGDLDVLQRVNLNSLKSVEDAAARLRG